MVTKTLRLIKRSFPVVATTRWINQWMRKLTRASHRLQFLVEWAVDNPEYFDHNIDMYSSCLKGADGIAICR